MPFFDYPEGYGYEFQTETLVQTNPVQNTWYTLLDTTEYCRVYAIGLNVEDDDETLQIRALVDGTYTNTQSVACSHSTKYYVSVLPDAINSQYKLNIASSVPTTYFLLEGLSVKIEVRKTTAGGVGDLMGIVGYGVLTKVNP